jgi:hypothetical protein
MAQPSFSQTPDAKPSYRASASSDRRVVEKSNSARIRGPPGFYNSTLGKPAKQVAAFSLGDTTPAPDEFALEPTSVADLQAMVVALKTERKSMDMMLAYYKEKAGSLAHKINQQEDELASL